MEEEEEEGKTTVHLEQRNSMSCIVFSNCHEQLFSPSKFQKSPRAKHTRDYTCEQVSIVCQCIKEADKFNKKRRGFAINLQRRNRTVNVGQSFWLSVHNFIRFLGFGQEVPTQSRNSGDRTSQNSIVPIGVSRNTRC